MSRRMSCSRAVSSSSSFGSDRVHGGDQLFGRVVLEHKPVRSGAQCFVDVFVEAEGREDQDPGGVTGGDYPPRRLEPVSRFCCHFDVRFAGKQHPKGGPDHRLVVSDQDTNRHDRYPARGRQAVRLKPPPLVVAVVISPP